MAKKTLDPAITYNLDDFIAMRYSDNATYYNFSILEKMNGVEHLSFNLIDDYLENIQTMRVELNDEQYKKYKYHPDLLAYDVYGSTQLDFVVMAINDIIDPKEFTRKVVYLPYASVLSTFLDKIYTANYKLIQQNRLANNISL